MTVEVNFCQEKHIGLITLTRPNALNALTWSMIKAIQQQLRIWQLDDSIRAVVISGEGDKAFCAGGDVRWLYEQGRQHNAELMQFFWHEYRLNHCIHHYPKPYIALLNGITMGGGVGVSLHGSHPIASERFQFAMPETSIGFFPDIGASYLLSRCPGELGIYLGLTGNRIGADDAYFCRLIKAIVPSERFPELLQALIETEFTIDSFKQVDECVQSFAVKPVEAPINAHVDTINTCFSAKTVEDVFSRLAKNQSDWAVKLKSALVTKSPLSLKVTLEQLRRATCLPLAECLKMDYCLVEHFMRDSDFYEGVRALLIDKDKSPQWHPASFQEVSNQQVTDYFESCHEVLDLIQD